MSPARALVALLLLLPACGARGDDPPAGVATPAATTAEERGWVQAETPDEQAERRALVAGLAHGLAQELALDPQREARVEALIAAAWDDVWEQTLQRAERGEPVAGDAVQDLLEARQRELDASIAALLTPEERARFAERSHADAEQTP